jgi:hypothetical protein
MKNAHCRRAANLARGVPDIEELDEEARVEIDKLWPKEWLGESSE